MLLCLIVYSIAQTVWKAVRVPPEQEGQLTLVCCGIPMSEQKRKKLFTQMSKIKSRWGKTPPLHQAILSSQLLIGIWRAILGVEICL